jgi:hypothetical protein
MSEKKLSAKSIDRIIGLAAEEWQERFDASSGSKSDEEELEALWSDIDSAQRYGLNAGASWVSVCELARARIE